MDAAAGNSQHENARAAGRRQRGPHADALVAGRGLAVLVGAAVVNGIAVIAGIAVVAGIAIVAGIAVVLALALNMDAIAGSQIPMLAAVQNMIPKIAGLYTIIIILGIFTTATGQLFLLGDRFATEGTPKFYAVIFGIVAFAIVGGLFIPFSIIVNIVYSILGMSGIIMAIFMVVKVLRVRSAAKKADAVSAPIPAPQPEPEG